jgi:hypothetical protein
VSYIGLDVALQHNANNKRGKKMSNPIEKAQQLGQKLFEIQTNTMQELAAMQQKNLENYFEMTREFTTRLPAGQDPQDLLNLQREVSESLWKNYQETNETTGELVRTAWDEVGEAYRSAFTQDSE